MKIKLIFTKFEPKEDEFIGFSFKQERNDNGFWVFNLVFFNLGFYLTPLFLSKKL